MTRKPFYEEVFGRADEFGKSLLQDVPELESIAIIPSWTVDQEHLPGGQIIWREGAKGSPAALFKMTVQLAMALRQHQQSVIELLHVLDDRLMSLARAFREQAQLTDAERNP